MYLNFDKPVRVFPKFNSTYISLIFNRDGHHENWESDPNAPKEMIFSFSNNRDKASFVEDYDISKNPKCFECPSNIGNRR